MKKIDIFFINDCSSTGIDKTSIIINNNIEIKINLFNLSNYELDKELDKANDLIKIYNNIKRVNIIFSKSIDNLLINKTLTKLNDILYNYYLNIKEIKLYQVPKESKLLMDELIIYKNIVMDPNKTPETYLDYVKSRIPNNYGSMIFKINETKLFPLTRAVGSGSSYNSYFVHIFPQNENPKNKTIYLIGKSVTFDAGGVNLKTHSIEDMKIDMTGSAIILSVLNLLQESKFDSNYNIHLLIPIVENMIGSKALKPGMVLKSMTNRTIEVTNTDAEGRLCLADGLDYVNLFLLKDKNPEDCLIIDMATLTGNTMNITSGISSLVMCNDKAQLYLDKLMYISEEIGEYVDYLKIRKEYSDMLTSKVADIKNVNLDIKAGCIIAGTFLKHFTKDSVPWIHIDVGVSTFKDNVAISYGVNLLYEFIKNL